jgi:TonB family protein
MLKQLLVITVVLTCAAAQSPKGYVEYGDYDARKCLKATKSEGGNEQLDLKCVDEIMDDLAKRAKGYPPSFRSDKERKRAERDVRLLAAMFDPIVAKDDAEVEMLLRAGFLNSMGHNLDIEGSAEKAINYFERLLKKEPDHVKGNYLYGIFLAATATKHKESVKYLEKAYRLGVVDAAYALGLVHLVLGDKRKSLEYLEAYAQNNPDDEKTKRLIEGIKSGRVEVKELGLTFSSLGDQQKALEHYHQALPIAHEAGPSSEALFIRIEIIATCSRLGKTREAVGCYQKDLELWRAAGDRGMQAEALDHLGDLYSALGEQKKAVDSHLKALELWRAIGDGNEAGTLERLSRLYLASGDQRKAREYYLQSLELEQESQETGVRTLAIKDDLGQELLKGIVIKRVMPSYPPEAKAALVSGDVGVRITISEKGKVIEAEAVSGPELLREAALKAARQWRFEPLLLRGTPVKVRGVLTFNFIVE